MVTLDYGCSPAAARSNGPSRLQTFTFVQAGTSVLELKVQWSWVQKVLLNGGNGGTPELSTVRYALALPRFNDQSTCSSMDCR